MEVGWYGGLGHGVGGGTLKKITGPGTLNQITPGVQRSGPYQNIGQNRILLAGMMK